MLRAESGALERDRTADLVLTKDALCQLSYKGAHLVGVGGFEPPASTLSRWHSAAELHASRHGEPARRARETGVTCGTRTHDSRDHNPGLYR